MLEELLEHFVFVKYYRKIAYEKDLNPEDFGKHILLDRETAEEIITNLLSIKFYDDKTRNVTIKILNDRNDEEN